jgi:hypothetical protein
MAPLAVVVLALASTPSWLPATGVVALTRSGGGFGGEAQVLAQHVLLRNADAHDGVTVAAGLRGAFAERQAESVCSGGLAFRLGYAVFDPDSPSIRAPLVHGWLQASLGVGAFTVKDAPLAPGLFRLGPTMRVEAMVSVPPLAMAGLLDAVGVFVERGPGLTGQDWRFGVMLGLSL